MPKIDLNQETIIFLKIFLFFFFYLKNCLYLCSAIIKNCSAEFAGNYGVEFRAYDNGIAYRFVLNKKSTVDVSNEGMRLQFPDTFVAHISKTLGFVTSYENPYTHMKISDYQATDEMSYLPVLLESPKGTKERTLALTSFFLPVKRE